MPSTKNRVALSTLLCLCAACGDSAPSLDAVGIEHVQRIDFDSTTQGQVFVGGTRQVDSYPMVAEDSTLVVPMAYGNPAYDFNVGEWFSQDGSLIVFRRVGENWQENSFLPAPPTTPNTGARLGIHLAMTGKWIFASYGDEVVVFEKEEDGWMLAQVLEDYECLAGLAAAPGMVVVVTSCFSEPVMAHLLEPGDSGWVETQAFSQPVARDERAALCADGPSVALTESTLAIGNTVPLPADPEDASGVVYLYEWDGSGFVGPETVLAPPEPAPGGRFGCDVAMTGERLVVTAPLENEGAGAAYVYRREPSGWIFEQRLEPTNTRPDQWFGFDVALSERWLLVGAPRDQGSLGGINNFGGELFETDGRPGAAYLFELADGDWVQRYYLKRPNPEPHDGFGGGVALDNGQVFVAGDSPGSNVMVWALME